jgi:hypothetical protein
MEIFLFLLLLLLFTFYDDLPLYFVFLLVIMFTFYAFIWYGGRRREWHLFLFAGLSRTKAGERIRQVLQRGVLAALCHSRFAHNSLWRRRYDFMTISMSVRHTTPMRWGFLRAFEQVLRKLASASLLGLRCTTTKANSGKDFLDAFETALGGASLGRLLSAPCAKGEAKLVCLIYAQESALFPAPRKRIDTTDTLGGTQARLFLFAVDRDRTSDFFLLPA